MSHASLPPIIDERAGITGREAIEESLRDVSLATKAAEPSNTTVDDLRALRTPLSFPELAAPSAPPLDSIGDRDE